LHFLRIFEVYTNFYKYNRKWKIKKHRRTVLGQLQSTGLALLAWPTAISTWPAQPTVRHARAAVTSCRVVVMARLAGGILCDKVLPTMTGALLGDDRARWGDQALTEAEWHHRGRESRVGGSIQRRRRRFSGWWWRRRVPVA
jgi:hypothetical protein